MKGRILAFFFVVSLAAGDALDDAVGQWAKKISSHLAADEVARVTWKEVASDAGSAAHLNRAKTLLARALQRRVRNPRPVEITATFSQNLGEYLFVAEIQRDDGRAVEMASVPRTSAAPSPAVGFRLDRTVLWEQEAPILDVAVLGADATGDQMLVLDTAGVTLYEQRESKWEKDDGAALDIPPVRDPRGRLTVMESAVVAEVAGVTCRGAWRPAVTLECQRGGRFTAGRNTIEEAGWPPYFAHAEIGGDHVIAATDGRLYIYDATRKQLSGFDLWADFAVISSACAGPKIVANDSASNALAVFELVNHRPVRVSDSVEMPGSITALWPVGSAALAVVRNKGTNRYEAYSIGVVCGR